MSRWGMLSYTANESICFYTQIFGKISQTEDKSLPSVTGSTPNVLLFLHLGEHCHEAFPHDDVPFWRYFSVKG